MSGEEQEQYGCRLNVDYPLPMKGRGPPASGQLLLSICGLMYCQYVDIDAVLVADSLRAGVGQDKICKKFAFHDLLPPPHTPPVACTSLLS